MPIEKLKKTSTVIIINKKSDFKKLLESTDLPVFYDDKKIYTTNQNNYCFVFFYFGQVNIDEWINGVNKDECGKCVYNK